MKNVKLKGNGKVVARSWGQDSLPIKNTNFSFLNKTIPHLSYENWFTCIYMYKIPKATFKGINLTVKNYVTINLEKKINTD